MLEHRYGALLLSHLLTGDPLSELGDNVTPHSVHFQASAFSSVDDLMIIGSTVAGVERRVSIGVRRAPNFVPSDTSTVNLTISYLRFIETHWTELNSGNWRLALAVASPNAHLQQIRELATIARDSIDSAHFRREVSRKGRTTGHVRNRLIEFDKLVSKAATSAKLDTQTVSAKELTWRLLVTLRTRELRLEGVDETDRTLAVGRLRNIVQDGSVATADHLYSRLVELSGRYAPAAATKTKESLARDLNWKFGLTEEPRSTSAIPTARSDYRRQVERIAPPQLIEREEELSFLKRYCTGAHENPYLWLRADAWAGKSALLSTFVLKPPRDIRIISFFITARFAGQADRTAFVDVVLEQALEIAEEPMPALVTDATRDMHLLAALDRAADLCRSRGQRLILILDGLDEDQGVTAGPDAHSIASLLPKSPPHDMRVVVAGRQNPPIPSDVPDDHPLRDVHVVRSLTPSTHAAVVRQDAERELKRLLRGSSTDVDSLGYLTAAGGGLSGADLAHLTGLSAWEIEETLNAVSGRTFKTRAGHWDPSTTVYILGHEELQRRAVQFLGDNRINTYREKLHLWADEYRSLGWPLTTPEYLIRGYFRLLHATSDIPKMLACATDSDRHDRMLDLTGGDTAALGEIISTQQLISSQSKPDLLAASRLSIHWAKLLERNEGIPTNLPTVWAQLNRPDRAEALARSITAPFRQVSSLAAVAREVALKGDLETASILVRQAERAVGSITDRYKRAQALAIVARAAARAGENQQTDSLIEQAESLSSSSLNPNQKPHVTAAIARAVATTGSHQRATRIARSITAWAERAQALAGVASEIANNGSLKEALKIARSISVRSQRAQALASVARAFSAANDYRTAVSCARDAERTSANIKNPAMRAWTLVSVAHSYATMGHQGEASKTLESAKSAALLITRLSDRDDIAAAIARTAAIAGNSEDAVAIALSITHPIRRLKGLAAAASGLATSGNQNRAETLARDTEKAARSIKGPSQRSRSFGTLAQALAASSEFSQAEEMAGLITDVAQRARTNTVIAQALATAGMTEKAWNLAKSIDDPDQQAKALFLVVQAVAQRGEHKLAREIAGEITVLSVQRKALAVARRKPSKVDTSSLGSRTPTIEIVAEPSPDEANESPYRQAQAQISVAQAAVAAGNVDLARNAISNIENRSLQAKAFITLSTSLFRSDNKGEALKFAEKCIAIARSLPSANVGDQLLQPAAEFYATIGEYRISNEIARSMVTTSSRDKAISSIAFALAQDGMVARAEEISTSIEDTRLRSRTLTKVVQALAHTHDSLPTAWRIARNIVEPESQTRALLAVAQAYGTIGESQFAEEVCALIVDYAGNSQQLTDVINSVDPNSARRIIARALATSHWQVCLNPLLRFFPNSAAAMAEELLQGAQ